MELDPQLREARRDQEEGGGAGPSTERGQERSRGGRWSWAQKVGLLLLQLFLSSSATDISVYFIEMENVISNLTRKANTDIMSTASARVSSSTTTQLGAQLHN